MKFKKIKSKEEISNLSDNYLIDAEEKTARAIVASLKQREFKGKIGVLGRGDAFNRRVVETLKINYLFSPEGGTERDTLKQRDSGINHVVAREAAKNKIAMIIDFNDIFHLAGKKRAIRIGKIIQNIEICRKVGCDIKIIGRKDSNSLASFGFSLGMSSKQVKDSMI